MRLVVSLLLQSGLLSCLVWSTRRIVSDSDGLRASCPPRCRWSYVYMAQYAHCTHACACRSLSNPSPIRKAHAPNLPSLVNPSFSQIAGPAQAEQLSELPDGNCGRAIACNLEKKRVGFYIALLQVSFCNVLRLLRKGIAASICRDMAAGAVLEGLLREWRSQPNEADARQSAADFNLIGRFQTTTQ